MFAPDAVGMHLADLGAEVVKVEEPGLGDPARLLGVPFRGESSATRRWNRGKQSLQLDLRSAEGRQVFLDLVRGADVVVEGMRAGALERRGLGYAALLAVNARLVFATVSGWGDSGPYRALGSHGLAFDAFAGLALPRRVDGRITRPIGHVWQGLEAGPLYAALGIVSAVLRARTTGEPARIEVSQADAAASWNGWRIAHDAQADRVAAMDSSSSSSISATSSEAASSAREALVALESAAEGGGREGAHDLTASDVRYQYYEASDGVVLLMATETRFWKSFCEAIGRLDLFERWPGKSHADHDYGNEALRDELTKIFAKRTQAEWIALFIRADVAGAPVHLGGETHSDPHFEARGLWLDEALHGLRLVAPPIRVDGELAVAPRRAPKAGEQTEAILRDVLGYDDARIEALRAAGAIPKARA